MSFYALRIKKPPLNSNRLSLIHKAFEKLDKSNDKRVKLK